MPTRSLNVRGFEIEHQGNLDAITVYLEDFCVGQGRITILCYGSAWTIYFGGMGANTIAQFIKSAGTDYLVNKLGFSQYLKQSKKHLAHLAMIIDAVKREL